MGHTAGPWTLPKFTTIDKTIRIREPAVLVDFDDVDHDEQAANARLIAAAPDLLAACQSMLRTCGSSADWNGETHESLKLIEAAIAKATA